MGKATHQIDINIRRKRLNYNKRRDMNLLKTILGVSNNMTDDITIILDIMDIYKNISELNLSKKFKNSIEHSKELIINPEQIASMIKSLENNDPDSFLIIPIHGDGHLFSTIIRSVDNYYSATTINKGLRNSHKKFEEYLFRIDKLQNLLDTLTLCSDPMIHCKDSEPSVEQIYQKFIDNSDKNYILKVTARGQKTGNCFEKNVEAGIKFAYATRKKKVLDIKKLRLMENSTNKKSTKTFKPKWKPIQTSAVHQLFVENLKMRSPNIAKLADEELQIYLQNKNFSKLIEQENPINSLFTAFDPENKTMHLPFEKRLKKLIAKISKSNYDKHEDIIYSMVQEINDPQYLSNFNKLLRYAYILNNAQSNNKFRDYLTQGKSPIEAILEAFYLDTDTDTDTDSYTISNIKKIKKTISNLDSLSFKYNKSAIKEILSSFCESKIVDSEFERLENISCKKKLYLDSIIKDAHNNFSKLKKFFPAPINNIKEGLGEYYLSNSYYLLRQGESLEALNAINNSIIFDSNNPTLFSQKGSIFQDLKKPEEALINYKKAIQLSPYQNDIYNIVAIAYIRMFDDKNALKYYKKALSINPYDKYALKGIARIHYTNGNFIKALKSLDDAIKQYPNNSEYYYFKGKINIKQNKFDNAILDYSKYIELKPDDLSGYFFRGYSYLKTKQIDKAYEDFSKCIEIEPDYIDEVNKVLSNYGVGYSKKHSLSFQNNDDKSVIPIAKKARLSSPSDMEIG